MLVTFGFWIQRFLMTLFRAPVCLLYCKKTSQIDFNRLTIIGPPENQGSVPRLKAQKLGGFWGVKYERKV